MTRLCIRLCIRPKMGLHRPLASAREVLEICRIYEATSFASAFSCFKPNLEREWYCQAQRYILQYARYESQQCHIRSGKRAQGVCSAHHV